MVSKSNTKIMQNEWHNLVIIKVLIIFACNLDGILEALNSYTSVNINYITKKINLINSYLTKYF